MKQCGPEVPCSNDFLGGGHIREVTTASAAMEIIQDSVSFVDGQTSMKNGVDPMSIEDVSDEEVSRGLMANALTIVSREMRPKLLCPQVDEEVVVPGVIGGDEEEVFVEKICIDWGSYSVRGKIPNEFGEDKCFLDFGS
jgi:hypothetical protein